MNYDEYLKCPFCKTERDGNGDCAYYCESDYCGRCGEDNIDRHSQHSCREK